MPRIHIDQRGSMVNSLPSEITTNILSRLPTDSVLQCKLVCKKWRHLLRHPSFAHKHLHQLLQLNGDSSQSSLIASKVGSGFLFKFAFTNEHGCQLYYGEYNDQPNNKLRRINQPPTHHHLIIGSCNGLICYSKDGSGPFGRSPIYEPAYICNPITSEYVKFPGLRLTGDDKVESMMCGFCYHQSVNKYKIVKIYYIRNQPLGKIQVYTLGSGRRWRNVGETDYSLRHTWPSYPNRSPFGKFVNGAIHWLDMKLKIVSFNLADEKLYLLPPPPCIPAASVQNYFELQILGGCLCFIHQKQNEFLDIWFLRKKEGYSSYDMNKEDYDSLGWIKEFSISTKSGASPIFLTNSGQILFNDNSGLFCYDPETTAVSDNLISNDLYRALHVVPHMSSLVSLNGLGEICCFRKRYNVNPAPKEIFVKQQKKDKGETDDNPSLTMAHCSGKQVVSPTQAISSDLGKSIPTASGVDASCSSKVADRNVGDSRKRKEKLHFSDRPTKPDHFPQELYSSDGNIPHGHCSRRSFCEGGSGAGCCTQKIVAHVEMDDDGDIGGTYGEMGTTSSSINRVCKRRKDGLETCDTGAEKAGFEPSSLHGQDVEQPRQRRNVNRPLPEYTAPQLCPPNYIVVAGFPVLPEYKDLYARVVASKGHMASDAKAKSMLIQATMVTELLEMIQRMSELSCCDVTSIDLQQWRAAVDTASIMDFHVSWLDDQLHLLESQIRDAEERKAMRRNLEAEIEGFEKSISLLCCKMDEARRAYKAAEADKVELVAKVAKSKASLASSEASNQATIALSGSALGSCLDTPH